MTVPLTVVTWRWLSPNGFRTTFAPDTVYAIKAMVERFYPKPFRFMCCTDRPDELPGIDTVPIWEEGRAIPPPNGLHNPSCYVRLKAFAPDAGKVFGPKLVSLDLDTVIVGDLSPLFDRDEDFIIWGDSDWPGKQHYNGSIWMLRTGARPQVWTEFDPERSPRLAYKSGARGSDQGWISHVLGPGEATWGKKDGIFSFRKDIAPKGPEVPLPPGARVIAFHGRFKQWEYRCSHYPWIKQFYPMSVPA